MEVVNNKRSEDVEYENLTAKKQKMDNELLSFLQRNEEENKKKAIDVKALVKDETVDTREIIDEELVEKIKSLSVDGFIEFVKQKEIDKNISKIQDANTFGILINFYIYSTLGENVHKQYYSHCLIINVMIEYFLENRLHYASVISTDLKPSKKIMSIPDYVNIFKSIMESNDDQGVVASKENDETFIRLFGHIITGVSSDPRASPLAGPKAPVSPMNLNELFNNIISFIEVFPPVKQIGFYVNKINTGENGIRFDFSQQIMQISKRSSTSGLKVMQIVETSTEYDPNALFEDLARRVAKYCGVTEIDGLSIDTNKMYVSICNNRNAAITNIISSNPNEISGNGIYVMVATSGILTASTLRKENEESLVSVNNKKGSPSIQMKIYSEKVGANNGSYIIIHSEKENLINKGLTKYYQMG